MLTNPGQLTYLHFTQVRISGSLLYTTLGTDLAWLEDYFFTQAASGNQTCPGMDPGDPNSPGHQSPILALVYSFGFGASVWYRALGYLQLID